MYPCDKHPLLLTLLPAEMLTFPSPPGASSWHSAFQGKKITLQQYQRMRYSLSEQETQVPGQPEGTAPVSVWLSLSKGSCVGAWCLAGCVEMVGSLQGRAWAGEARIPGHATPEATGVGLMGPPSGSL